MTIVEFLTARLNEEAAAVRVATRECGPNWEVVIDYRGAEEILASGVDRFGNPIQERLIVDDVDAGAGVAHYIARQDPAKTMREIEAKRAILDLTVGQTDRWGDLGPEANSMADDVVKAMASVYQDHPDYAAIE